MFLKDAALSVRRITVTAARVVPEEAYEAGKNAAQELDLFADTAAEARKERQRQYAKILPGATAIERSGQVSGYRSGC